MSTRCSYTLVLATSLIYNPPVSETALIEWFRANRKGKKGRRTPVDSGDDCALVRVGGGEVLFKTDGVTDGVHFQLRHSGPEAVGHKALARTLSDVAAMGGVPTHAVAALLLPRRRREAIARGVFRGMERTARRYRVAIVGGDVAVHDGPLSVTVSLLGEMKGVRPVLRSGGRPGDGLFVTGPLGGSIRGKHLSFEPRLKEGRAFARRKGVHAMIDISDGLARDLRHICKASGTGADLEDIPCSPGTSVENALFDGEDYELLVAANAPLRAIRIGRLSTRRGIRYLGKPVKNRGYDHLR